MGDIIGGLIGGIGSLVGGSSGASNALKGYNYLTKGGGADATNSFVNNGAAASNANAQLLGLQPITAGTSNGFSNYLDSTGFKFQLGQGENAITSNAASRGLLNSGGTGKGLIGYGQNLAKGSFDNYLSHLGSTSAAGQTSLGQVAGAGTQGGAAAGQMQQDGITTGAGAFGQVASNPGVSNFFNGLFH